MTRIIAGRAGSTRLRTTAGDVTRPTSDRVREAVFSTLESWGFCTDTRVLDLYAGSGALGLEAVSRGARSADLVERHAGAMRTIRENVRAVSRALAAAGSAEVPIHTHTVAVRSFLRGYSGEPFDVVFCDPPYPLPNSEVEADLEALLPHLVADAVVLVERDARTPEPTWPPGLRVVRSKRYGETLLWWLEPSPTTTEGGAHAGTAPE